MQSSTQPTIKGVVARWLIAVVVLALAVGPGILEMTSSRNQALGLDGAELASRKGPRFRINGKVGGLYPGARKTLTLRLRNPNRYRIKVKSLKVRVVKTNRRGCHRKWLRPKKVVRVSVLVPRRARAFVGYPISLSKNVPNACKRAKFSLRFRGRAVRVR